MLLPAETVLWKFGKGWVVPFVEKYYHIKYSGEIPHPPYLLICNHVSPIDPFLIAPHIDVPISWVVAQISFQNSIERYFLKKIGAIPKSKSRPDPTMVHSIYNILDRGGVVGLFPEGTITWTGDFQDHLLSERGMEKLILSLEIPSVASRIQGAWLSHPVWATKARKPTIFIDFKTFSDRSAMEFIRHSEWEWQKINHIAYPGKRKALGIERVLWICPHCSHFRTLIGREDTLICTSCQSRWMIDDYGFIGGQSLPDLFNRQIKVFIRWVNDSPPLTLPPVKISLRNARTTWLINSFSHQLNIQNDRLSVGSVHMDISKMKGLNTHFRDILEFLYEDTLVRIKSNDSSFLLYNWMVIRKKILDSMQQNETTG